MNRQARRTGLFPRNRQPFRARFTTTEVVNSASLTAATDAIAALRTAMRAAGGFPVSLSPVQVTGTGSPVNANMTMPDSGEYPINAGDKHELTGYFQVIAQEPAVVVGFRRVEGLVLSRGSGVWNDRRTGEFAVTMKHADFANYFASDSAFPDVANNSGALACLYTGIADAIFTIDGDFVITNKGVDAPA